MSQVKITETVLRDGHQSLIATRLTTEQMIPILEKMDAIGYHAMECWGGATFDVALRYMNEDPWERLRNIRGRVKHTKLQMLLRGQNLLGYKHYPDDVVEDFIKRSIDNGIDVIRVFDALNDLRNLETSIQTICREGGHAQAAISYTTSPVHTRELYVKMASEMVQMGAHSIAIKDMSGLLTPFEAFDLVSALKKNISVPIELHTHCTSGLADMTYLKAIEAGADIIDTAISPFALGTSQPATEALVATLAGTKWDTGLNLAALNDVCGHFTKIREESISNGVLDTKVLALDVNALLYQVPGGMLSNLVSQLKMQNAMNAYEEVLKEVPRVRKDMGYPPLVTPTSQIIGTQAVMNVLSGERYKMIPNEVKAYVKGLYGQPPSAISAEVIEKIIGTQEIVEGRPADLLEPMINKARLEIKEFIESDEDVLTYILFPQQALNFFKYRQAKRYQIDEALMDSEYKVYPA